MGKKIMVLFIVIAFLLVFSVFANAQIDTSELKESVEGVKEKTEQIKKLTERERLEELSEQWRQYFLENRQIFLLDAGLRKLNFIFVFLFSEPYELSLTLFFAILLWLFFFYMFARIISDFSTFGETVSHITAFLLSIIIAHLRAYNFISLILFKIIFYREGVWPWISFLLILLIIVLTLTFLRLIIWKVGRAFKGSKEEREKWDEKFRRELFEKKVEGIEKAFGKVGGALDGK